LEEFLEQSYSKKDEDDSNGFHPQRIVYMSCDPVTQARDAEVLISKGGYKITSIQPFDLFPQTRHIECLMIFERA
jgi:tRNA (uracil-5-)-methyltransferase